MGIAPDPDRQREDALLRDLVDAPALTRRLYRRGGFDGLEPNTLQVLVALHRESDRTVKALTEQLVLRQPTVSTALARLRDRGLVAEHADPSDGRRRRQHITRRGRALVRRLLSSVD
jgi:DNA-binding MarR family transcriptional regulator